MGLILNPIAFRIGYLNSWSDAWFMHRMYYPVFLHNVLLIKALIFYVLYFFFPGKRSKWVYSHLNLYIYNNRIFLNVYVYDATLKYKLYWNYNKLRYDRFQTIRLKSFWLKKQLLNWNFYGQKLFILLKWFNIFLDKMSFDFVGAKYSFRRLRKIKGLKDKFRKQGRFFTAREEIGSLKKLLGVMKLKRRKLRGRSIFKKFDLKKKFFIKRNKRSFLKKNLKILRIKTQILYICKLYKKFRKYNPDNKKSLKFEKKLINRLKYRLYGKRFILNKLRKKRLKRLLLLKLKLKKKKKIFEVDKPSLFEKNKKIVYKKSLNIKVKSKKFNLLKSTFDKVAIPFAKKRLILLKEKIEKKKQREKKIDEAFFERTGRKRKKREIIIGPTLKWYKRYKWPHRKQRNVYARFGLMFASRYFWKWYRKAFKFKFNVKYEFNYFYKDVLKWRKLKYNYIFLFYILSYIDTLFKNSVVTYPRFVFRKWDVVYMKKIYFTWFRLRPIYLKFKKLVELIMLKFGLNVIAKMFVIDNASVSASFIARYIAYALKLNFDFWDVIIPIKRNLKRLMFVRVRKNLNIMAKVSKVWKSMVKREKALIINIYRNYLIFIVAKMLISINNYRLIYIFSYQRKILRFMKKRVSFPILLSKDFLNLNYNLLCFLRLKFFYFKGLNVKLKQFLFFKRNFFDFKKYFGFDFLKVYIFFVFIKNIFNKKYVFIMNFFFRKIFKVSSFNSIIFFDELQNDSSILNFKQDFDNNIFSKIYLKKFKFFLNLKNLIVFNNIHFFDSYKLLGIFYFYKKQKKNRILKKNIKIGFNKNSFSFFLPYVNKLNKFSYIFYFKRFFERLYYSKISYKKRFERFSLNKYKSKVRFKYLYFLKKRNKNKNALKGIFWKHFFNFNNSKKILKKFRNKINNPSYSLKINTNSKLLNDLYFKKISRLKRKRKKDKKIFEFLKVYKFQWKLRKQYKYRLICFMLGRTVKTFDDKLFNLLFSYSLKYIKKLLRIWSLKTKKLDKIRFKLKANKYKYVRKKKFKFEDVMLKIFYKNYFKKKLQKRKRLLKKIRRKVWFFRQNFYYLMSLSRNFNGHDLKFYQPFPYNILEIFLYMKKLKFFSYIYKDKLFDIEQFKNEDQLENWENILLKYKLKRMKYLDNNNAILYGYKFQFKGRFTRKQKAANLWFSKGAMPMSTMSENVDYGFHTVTLEYSACTIKVWLYKGQKAPTYLYKI